MDIKDDRGRSLNEATLQLTREELTDLLVAVSRLDDESEGHAVIQDEFGRTLGLYTETGEPGPIERQTDWWLGPLILVLVVLMIVGAFTVTSALVRLIF